MLLSQPVRASSLSMSKENPEKQIARCPTARKWFASGALAVVALSLLAGCGNKRQNQAAETPPPTRIEHVQGVRLISVAQPEQFPLFTAEAHVAFPTLSVNGVVAPDVSRTVPVVSLASGRVVAIMAHLGDTVRRGQLLMKVASADISTAYSTYRKAVADQTLADAQVQRAKLLYARGAISRNDLQIAADAAQKAAVDTKTASQGLAVLGVGDPNAPQSATVNVYAPASGVIVSQDVTAGAAVGMAYSGSSIAFTIADLSHVWILCSVYENNLPAVAVGQKAVVHLDAYPNLAIQGVVSEISPILDPSLRTAKVRIQVPNPHRLMRVGMFVSATLYGTARETHTAVPAAAVLHLHDRDWVYVPEGNKQFRRVDVVSGAMLPGNMQEVVSGLQPGQQVVANALALQSTVNP